MHATSGTRARVYRPLVPRKLLWSWHLLQRHVSCDRLGRGGTVASACPNGCSGHGVCSDNVCQCHPGWSALDCSVPTCPSATAMPTGTATTLAAATAGKGGWARRATYSRASTTARRTARAPVASASAPMAGRATRATCPRPSVRALSAGGRTDGATRMARGASANRGGRARTARSKSALRAARGTASARRAAASAPRDGRATTAR